MIDKNKRFEALLLPHMDAAYNLARWLLHDGHLAEDVVQDAYLNAFRFFDTLRGEAAKPWLLGIVRNASFDLLRQRGREPMAADIDVDIDWADEEGVLGTVSHTPEAILLERCSTAQIDTAIAALPPVFREVIVLRELEEMSYQDIAQLVGVPVGTVMSRLARARGMLRTALAPLVREK